MFEEQDGWILIPADIVAATDLTWAHKVLWGAIKGLSNKSGYCWASNQYLADKLQYSPDTISTYISDLVEKGYLVRTYPRGKSTRRLYAIQKVVRKAIQATEAGNPENNPDRVGDEVGNPENNLNQSGKYSESNIDNKIDNKEILSSIETLLGPDGSPLKPWQDMTKKEQEHYLIEVGEAVWGFWNQQPGLMHHKTQGIRREMYRKLKPRLEEGRTLPEIKQAIAMYAETLNDPNCWVDYSWTLPEFLGRNGGGLIDRFLQPKEVLMRRKTKPSNVVTDRRDELIKALKERLGDDDDD